MEFIATYWWVWLVGVLVVFAIAGLLSIANLVGLVKDSKSIADKARYAMSLSGDDRKQELTNLGLDLAYDKVKGRVVKTFSTAGLFVVGGIIALLLLIALVRQLAFYFQGSAG